MCTECCRRKALGEPYDGERHVRFDEGVLETGSWNGTRHRQTGKPAGNSHSPFLRLPRQRPTLQMVNVLDALPKTEQPEATQRLRAMMYAASRSACERKRDEFLLRFKKTDPKACATLARDWERLVTFFDYPREHWIHLRTTNIVESPFAAVRLRTDAARRFKKTESAEAMIWKLLRVAEQSWRALNAPNLMRDVHDGKRFKDGVAVRTRIEPTRKAA